jgi:hypothetical protein
MLLCLGNPQTALYCRNVVMCAVFKFNFMLTEVTGKAGGSHKDKTVKYV